MSNLRPYHAFEIDGNHYVYSVWGMSYRRVSGQTVEELAKERGGEAAELGPETIEAIKALGLRWSAKVRGEVDIQGRDHRTVAAAREKPAAINTAALFVTQDCNMRCPYCYGDGGGYGGSGAMSEGTAFRAVDWLLGQAGDSKEVWISFFGGEPLLNFELIEKVVAYAREKAGASRKLEFAMTTNLSLLDDRILDFLVANKVTVLASFDGPPHIQNRNRPLKNGQDSYGTVAPKVRKLLAALPDSSGRSTLVAGDDPGEVARELAALGFQNIHIECASGCLLTGSHAASGGRPEVGPHEALIALLYDRVARFRQAVARRDAEEVRALARLRNLENYMGSFLGARDLLHSLARGRRYFFCGRAMAMVGVAANGDIYPCHRFVGTPEYRMGNVHTGEFRRDEFLRSPLVENPECASCWARYICGGNCQHDNAAATGDPLRPDPNACADRRARIEYAIHAVGCLGDEDRRWLAELGVIEERKCMLDF
jgi:uncharacterized protein